MDSDHNDGNMSDEWTSGDMDLNSYKQSSSKRRLSETVRDSRTFRNNEAYYEWSNRRGLISSDDEEISGDEEGGGDRNIPRGILRKPDDSAVYNFRPKRSVCWADKEGRELEVIRSIPNRMQMKAKYGSDVYHNPDFDPRNPNRNLLNICEEEILFLSTPTLTPEEEDFFERINSQPYYPMVSVKLPQEVAEMHQRFESTLSQRIAEHSAQRRRYVQQKLRRASDLMKEKERNIANHQSGDSSKADYTSQSSYLDKDDNSTGEGSIVEGEVKTMKTVADYAAHYMKLFTPKPADETPIEPIVVPPPPSPVAPVNAGMFALFTRFFQHQRENQLQSQKSQVSAAVRPSEIMVQMFSGLVVKPEPPSSPPLPVQPKQPLMPTPNIPPREPSSKSWQSEQMAFDQQRFVPVEFKRVNGGLLPTPNVPPRKRALLPTPEMPRTKLQCGTLNQKEPYFLLNPSKATPWRSDYSPKLCESDLSKNDRSFVGEVPYVHERRPFSSNSPPKVRRRPIVENLNEDHSRLAAAAAADDNSVEIQRTLSSFGRTQRFGRPYYRFQQNEHQRRQYRSNKRASHVARYSPYPNRLSNR
ncbi:hypothetical protein ACOME3_005806 [Neoechinorhynchus agilis]